MPNAKTKRKIRFREAEERALLEEDGWVFVYNSKMTIDCNGIQLIFGPRGHHLWEEEGYLRQGKESQSRGGSAGQTNERP